MNVRLQYKAPGTPTARVAVAAWGPAQLTVNISAEDSYGMPHQAVSLQLTNDEARDLAERILRLVNK